MAGKVGAGKSTARRVAAAAIAMVAWLGLAVQARATYRQTSSVWLTLWILFAYFTIATNLFVALVFTFVAAGRMALEKTSIVANAMLSILLVGIVYGLLLHGSVELSGGSLLANIILHMVTPVVVPLFWIFLIPKGELKWRDPFLWSIYPLAYLAYALARGSATGKYPYPFLDVIEIGWRRTAVHSVLIAAAFLLAAFLIAWFDRICHPGRRAFGAAHG